MASPSRIICLNLGMQTVGMAEFHAGADGSLVLEQFRLTEILADPSAEASRLAQVRIALNEMRGSLKTKATRAAYTIPAQAVFTRFVKLPTVGEEKVEQIIQFEAQQNVPFPIDEVVWDYQLVSGTGAGQMEVVLVAIKSEMLDEVNETVADCGFKATVVDVAPMALYNAFRYNYSDVPGCSLLIDVGARTTNLIFVEPGKVFTRSIPIGGTNVTQAVAKDFEEGFGVAEERKRQRGLVSLGGSYAEPDDPEVARLSKVIRNSLTRLHAEIARSISFYRSQQGGSQPLRAYLCGGAVSLPYAREFFSEKLNLPVEFFNPLRNVQVAPSVNMDDASRSSHVMGELVGLGLRAVSDCPMELNLRPESANRAEAAERRQPFFIAAGVCLLLTIAGFFLYFSQAAKTYQAAVTAIEPQVQQLSGIEAQFKKVADDKKGAIRMAAPLVQVISDRDYWVRLMDDLNARLPAQYIWITNFETGFITPDKGDKSGKSDKFSPMRFSADAGGAYLPEGISLTPAASVSGVGNSSGGNSTGGGSASAGGPGAAGGAAAKGDGPVLGLRIHGLYLDNPSQAAVVDEFAKGLEASPFVAGVAVTTRASRNDETWAYDWELNVKLKEAISTP